MKKALLGLIIMVLGVSTTEAKSRLVTIKLIETTDVHGSFFPYDFINRKEKSGSMARVYSFVEAERAKFGRNVLLLENGDLLQGQPTCYYYNYIATNKENIGAQVINFMGYDAQCFGNHDVETGHSVYDKWIRETKCPVLGANIVDSTGRCYVQPYQIYERDGVRIAVLGMLTPVIPCWLDESLWKGLHFENMVTSARKWVKYIQDNEHPDAIVGLFHSGRNGGIKTSEYDEDATETIAREVPGFDVIFYGHDHIKYGGTIKNTEGKDVWILDPANNARNVAVATLEFKILGSKVSCSKVSGELVCIDNQPISQSFMDHFKDDIKETDDYVNCWIGKFEIPMSTRDCFFGDSYFTDFIQKVQLDLTGADISLTAPLAFDAQIRKGDIYVADMFNLYKFENRLCLINMTGEEIRRHLEMSYDQWVSTMNSPEDHIMLLNTDSKDDNQRSGFKNYTFNFDSASGIDYEVDVTKPDGYKVRILRMSNGQPFDLQKTYKVALNSYRANGGGELLTRGAGIPKAELEKRILWKSDKDLRYYLMQEIIKQGNVRPRLFNNWRFVPENFVKKAIERDRAILFEK